MANGFLTPVETSKSFVGFGETKAKLPLGRMFVLAILAGVYVGFGAQAALTGATGQWADYFGVAKILFAACFTVGLMLVVIAGVELFIGNSLMTVALCSGRIGMGGLMRNWVVVYLGNLVGSVLLALMVVKGSGLLEGPVGGTALQLAVLKTSSAALGGVDHNWAMFLRAIGCNWLVRLAVMMAVSARDVGGKVLAMFFPVFAFVVVGFEHSVANMYFIPAALLAKSSAVAVAASGLTPDKLVGLTWTTMWTQNLVAVALGNIVGGAIFVGMGYFYAHVCGSEVCVAGGASAETVKES
jgi:formate transporter